MPGKTTIQWTDMSWNPITGCQKVSEGCRNCYAKAIHDRRYKAHLSGKEMPKQYHDAFEVVQFHENRLDFPLHVRKPTKFFVNSGSDVFHESVSYEFIRRMFDVMIACRQHTFQILTKRPHRMLDFTAWHIGQEKAEGFTIKQYPSNVWFGVSVEDQATANSRIPLLLQTPAAIRFISAEPLLGEINGSYGQWLSSVEAEKIEDSDSHKLKMKNSIDWVICGGESGKNARPMHPDWARSLRNQCQAAGVPFFFKQWGAYLPVEKIPEPGAPGIYVWESQDGIRRNPDYYTVHQWDDHTVSIRLPKYHNAELDGLEWHEHPLIGRSAEGGQSFVPT